MSAETILQHLDKVRSTGSGKWLACCPAHDDRSPSLSIRKTDNSTVLVHCFCGCSAAQGVTTVSAETILQCLDKVRQTGTGIVLDHARHLAFLIAETRAKLP